MTLVITANVAGQARGEPVRLSRRRRRLSTIVARHRPPAGRRFIVSVHRQGEVAYRPNDGAVRLRAAWPRTLVGPKDVVLITVVPLGRGVASIGLAIAAIALIAIAPYAAPGIAAGLAGAGIGVSAGVVQAGLVIGGVALSYAAQASAAAKKQTQNPLYSVSGGGNIPKANGRKPLLYGKSWSSPPLSQKDYFTYDGDTMVLVKRMTLGIGKFQVHRVRVGDALYWDEATGIQAPFNAVTGPLGAAFEILYEAPSTISPGDVITSTDVGGQEMPRVGGNPDWTPWFRLTPQGVTADAAQMSWTYPAIYRETSAGRRAATVAAVTFQGREIDPATGNVVGAPFTLWHSSEGSTALTSTPLRRSAYFRLPRGGMAIEVRAQNAYPEPVDFVQENRSSWDEMTAFKDDVRVRPKTTELAMRVRAGKGLTITAFSDVTVEATRIVEVWDGSTWTEQPARKAVWAFCDLVRAEYGLARPDGVDADKALYYANLLTANDTYDGQLLEVSSFWEAAGEILLPLRADPVKVGAIHSFVRDESRAEPRHILTRRQIVRDSGGATYRPQGDGGDVIVEFNRDGDPMRPDEVRYSYGPPSRTPKRYKVAGISDGGHALEHATWLAAIAVFRGAERRLTTEWDGRLVFPGDHVLSDLWFLRGKQVFGVASRTGNALQLDADANVAGTWGYGSIRTRVGREWGILRMRGAGVRGLELHPDDVSALSAQTGLTLPDVLARDTQDPTTIVLGELVELQESYVARSAIPSDADHVQIELVRDDPRVWQLLGETAIQPAPINADSLAEPLMPQISVLHARCERIETGIEVVWGVSITRGARNYEADISYDQGATWDDLSPFGPASSGRAPMRQVDGPVTVRARAYGRTGLHGDWIATTFTTIAPVVLGNLLEEFSVTIEKLSAQTQKEIADINALGRGTLALGQTVLDQGSAAAAEALEAARVAITRGDDTIRGTLRQIAEALNRLGDAQATETTNSYLARQLLKVGTSANFAAIERVDEARISNNEAFAGITTTLGVRLTLAEGNIVGNATAIQGLSTSVTSIDGRVTAQSMSITQLGSRIDANDLAISGQATATQQLTTRVTINEGTIVSLSQSLTVLQSTVSIQGGQIQGQATAIDQLTTRVTGTEGSIVSEAQRTTALQSVVSTQGGQITGTSTALNQLTTRVTGTENSILAEAAQISALDVRITSNTGQIAATASFANAVNVRVDSVEGVVNSNGQVLTALVSTVQGQGTALSGQASAASLLTTRVTSAEGSITAQTQQINSLQAQITTQGGQIVAGAQYTDAVNVRVGTVEGVANAAVSATQALQSQVNGHTATLTTYGASIDGVKVQFGVTGYIDGTSGGFVFTGVRRLDGTVDYSLNISGNVFVDGSITGQKLAAYTITTSLLTTGQLIVNGHIFDGAISTLKGTESNGPSAVYTYTNSRGVGTRLAIFAFFTGSGANTVPNAASAGTLSIRINGNTFKSVGAQTYPFSGNFYLMSQAICKQIDVGTGTFDIQAYQSNVYGYGACDVLMMEISK